MSSRTQDELYNRFIEASGKQTASLENVSNSLTEAAARVNRAQPLQNPTVSSTAASAGLGSGLVPNLGSILSSLVDVVSPANTVKPTSSSQSSQAQSSTGSSAPSGGGIGSTVESIASTVLKSGFGVVPLVGELFGLFGAGGSSAPAPLVKYAMPAKMDFEAAETSSGLSNTDYDQFGMPRPYAMGSTTSGSSGSVNTNTSNNTNGAGKNTTTSSSPQITVNVQAMDTRSFLDRSTDIAAAVRDAMLNLSSINDVVNDL